MTTPSRAEWVDHAKAIGILLVVYGHTARGVQSADMAMDDSLFTLVDSVIYSFHMPLFFFLSGLFLYGSLQKRGATGTLLGKLDTVLYPYVLWSLLQGGVELLFARYTNGVVTPAEVLDLSEPRAQFWFLYALLLVLVLAIPLYARLKPHFFGASVLAAAVLFVYQAELPQAFNIQYLYYSLVFFVAGVWFSAQQHIILPQSRRLLLPTLLLFAFAQWLFHGYYGFDYQSIGPGLLALAAISIFAVTITTHALAPYLPHWLAYVGASSMAIYLMHILVGSGVRVMLHKLFGIVDAKLHIALGTLLAVVMPLLALALMKRAGWMGLIEAPRRLSGLHWYQRKLASCRSSY